ncbi:MAG: RNase adapter RapZ [Alphaproteobacteria bacterium]|nr:RNase adapter RapZ [Alphaproteobacteria bacterium]
MSAARPDLLLVTGLSGAGRSTALNALEDLGFEAVDNLPLGLLERLLPPSAVVSHGAPEHAPLAVGVDVRTRDFDAAALKSAVARLTAADGVAVRILYLECDDEVLIRRFAETRRRHPLAADRPAADGIRLERRALAPLRDLADLVLDTTDLTVWDLKRRLQALFGAAAEGSGAGPVLTVMSFAFRRGLPREADMVLDVRFLDNPHYDPALQALTGLDAPVAAHIAADPDFEGFLEDVMRLLARTLPRYEREGKSYLTMAVGCTGGWHRSVYTAERLAERLEAAGRRVNRFHRDLERSAAAGVEPSNEAAAVERKERAS